MISCLMGASESMSRNVRPSGTSSPNTPSQPNRTAQTYLRPIQTTQPRRWEPDPNRRRSGVTHTCLRGGPTNCIVEDQNRVRWVIQQVGERPGVLWTYILSPAIDSSNRWTIQIKLDSKRLLPEIVSLLGEAEMEIRDVEAWQSW